MTNLTPNEKEALERASAQLNAPGAKVVGSNFTQREDALFGASARMLTEAQKTKLTLVDKLPPVIFGGRMAGKTFTQVAALPDGAIFIVHDRKFEGHVREILQAQGRPVGALQIIPLSETHSLRWLGGVLDVDHHARDVMGGDAALEIERYLSEPRETPLAMSVLAAQRARDGILCERLIDLFPAHIVPKQIVERIEQLNVDLAEACHERDGLLARLEMFEMEAGL